MRTLILLAILFASPVAAQSGWPVEPAGRLAFGATDRQPGADVFVAGDATLRYAFRGLPLGLELGTFGFANALDSPHETYGAVTWDVGPGRISAGVPRPAYDSVAISALERGFPTLGADRARITRSEATWGAMFANYLPFGVSFAADGGRLRYALSVHRADNVGVTLAGVGASFTDGPWTVAAAVEGRWAGTNDVSVKLQGIWSQGRAEAGFGLFAPAGAADAAEAFAAYGITDCLTVTGVLQAPLAGGEPTAGLSGRYAITRTAGVSLGVASVPGTSAVVSGFLDVEF